MLAIIKENINESIDGKYLLSLHEHDGMPAYKKVYSDDIEALKAKVNVEWREPTEADETDGDVILLGE